MSLIKQLIPRQLKFTPASSEVNWTRVETLVHGPGAGVDTSSLNSAVFACLMTVASSYPEPPLCVYRKTSQGKSEKIEDHPLQILIDAPTPNGELSTEEIQFWTAWALHVDGNAYWLKVRSGDALTGNVIQLWPVSPSLMAPVTERNSGDWISYYQYRIAPNQTVAVPVKNVIHFRLGLDDRDMRKGLAPLKHLVRQISTDDEADRFVDALLKNFAVPGLVVIPAQGVSVNSESEADRIADKMRRKFGNDNRGNVAVMSKEVTVEQFGFSPKDLDLSVLHRIPEERISAVIGVPAIVAGLGAGLDRATYANFKEAREMFTEQKLIPQWRTSARKLNTSLKPDFTQDKKIYIDYDLTNVRTLQEDEDSKYKRLTEAVGKPFIKRNEARTDVGLDPIPEWDTEDAEPPAPPPVPVPAPNPDDANAAQPDQEQQEPPAKALDLDKWQRKAIKAIEAGKFPVAPFESDHISDDEHAVIVQALTQAKTAEDVRGVFAPHIKAAQEPDQLDRLILEMHRANNLLETAA